MRSLTRFTLLCALALSLFAAAPAAFAAPADWESIDITLQAEEQQPMLLVSGELPSSAKLPYEGELAVPTGTQIQWSGEILGGDPSKDPSMKLTKVSSANGMDVYRFTLTKARIGQIEGILPGSTGFDGTNYTSALKWTAWKALPEVRVNARIPSGAKIAQASPGATLIPADNTHAYYSKTVKDVAADQAIDLTFSYAVTAAAANQGAASASGGSDSTPVIVIVLLAAAGFIVLWMGVQRKMASRAPVYEYDDESDASGEDDGAQTADYAFAEDLDEAPAEEPAPKRAAKAAEKPRPTSKRVQDERTHSAAPAVSAKKPVGLVLAVLGVFIIGFLIAGRLGSSAAVVDGKISRDFGAPSACQSASIAMTPNQGVDLAEQGEQLLKAFEGMEGVGDVTVDLQRSAIDLAWCKSSQSEASMRQALQATGLVTLGGPAEGGTATPATSTVQ